MKNVKYTDSSQFRCLENLKKTSLDLYLVHAGIEQCVPSFHCPGCKDEYIIHFILSGKGTYKVGSRTWNLSAGDMFLIYPNEYVTYTSDNETPWFYAWIGFNGIRTNTILKNCGFSRKNLVQNYSHPDKIQKQITNLLDKRQLSFSDDLRRQAFLSMLLADLVDDYTVRNPRKASRNHNYGSSAYVEQAIEYIKYSYQEGINVTDISDYIGITRTYLNQTFQKELGVSVQNFLISFRLHKAANLLIETDMTINEISKSVGYEDSLTFSKAFKKKFEASPRNYREQRDNLEHFTEKQPWER